MSIDSARSLQELLKVMDSGNYNYHGVYLILLTSKSTSELDQMFDLLWRSFIYNVNILVQINNSVKMFTFFPFNNQKCHDTKSVEINEYSSGKWQKSVFFPPKLRNFHTCQMIASCFEYGPSAFRTDHGNGTISFNGSDVEILQTIGRALNMNMIINITTELGSWGQIWENGSAIGAFEFVMNGKVDICGNLYLLTELRSKFMQFTQSYFSTSLMLIIPRGAPLSAFQKLFRPFKLPVWYSVIGFFVVISIAVLVIKRQSKRVQILFFDRNINAVVMEMLVVFFGSSQHMLPRRNFPRILMMTFALYCLVMRTVYTGSMFKFLQV
jgi:hypothetical protein